VKAHETVLPAPPSSLPAPPPEHDPVVTRLKRGPVRQAHPGKLAAVPGLEAGATPRHFARTGLSGDPLRIFKASDLTSTIGSPGNGWEDSQARAGDVVFYTFNWGAAYSTDGGDTFRLVDATSDLPAGEPGLCDQQVIYSPQIDRFIWIRQTGCCNPDCSVENRYRIAVASPSTVASSDARRWSTFDITPATFGISGKKWWFDFDGVSVGPQNFFITFNVVGSGRSMVGRIPLSALARTTGFFVRFYFPDVVTDFRVAQNIGPRAYFAGQKDNSTLRVFYWDDSSTLVYYRDVAVSSISENFSSVQPDGVNWLDSFSKVSKRILGATRVGSQVWYAWTGGIDGRFAQPHVEIAIIDVPSLTLASERYLWSPNFAFAYPDLATSSVGDVAIAYSWGGGIFQPRTGIGFLTGRQDLINTSDTGEGSGGHYLTLRRDWPKTRLFTVGNYWQPFIDRTGITRVNHSQFIVFGRLGDSPTSGLPPFRLRADLVITAVRKDEFTVANKGALNSGPFSVSVVNDARQFSQTFSFNGLAVGAALTQTFQCQPAGVITVTADINDEVSETDEANNSTDGLGNTCIFAFSRPH
jgi:hypothetical protein